MNVDLHTHTYPASDCSHISYRDYIAWCVDNGRRGRRPHQPRRRRRTIASSSRALADEGVLLIHGVEISTLFGDFVVFSPDLDYLARSATCRTLPRPASIPDDAAVVWVHPAAGGGRSGSAYYPGLERMVAGVVDAVEVYNGTWLGDRYVDDGRAHRRRAGRGAHRRQRRARAGGLMALLHGVPDPVRSTADVVTALKAATHSPAPRARRRAAPLRLFEEATPCETFERADPRSAWSFVDITGAGRRGRRARRRARRRRRSSTCRTPRPA